MEVIGNDDEFVKQIFLLVAIVSEGVSIRRLEVGSRRKIGWRCAVTVVIKKVRSESISRWSLGRRVLSRIDGTICGGRVQNGIRGLKVVRFVGSQRGP